MYCRPIPVACSTKLLAYIRTGMSLNTAICKKAKADPETSKNVPIHCFCN